MAEIQITHCPPAYDSSLEWRPTASLSREAHQHRRAAMGHAPCNSPALQSMYHKGVLGSRLTPEQLKEDIQYAKDLKNSNGGGGLPHESRGPNPRPGWEPRAKLPRHKREGKGPRRVGRRGNDPGSGGSDPQGNQGAAEVLSTNPPVVQE